MNLSSQKSFTLIELLIVIALLSILSIVVVVVINPSEMIKQTRDSRRLADLANINLALSLLQADCPTCFFGSSSVVYVSIPDISPNCSNLGLPPLPSGWSYACSSPQNYRKIDGSGWIPVDLTKFSAGSPLASYPVDPVNQTSTGEYYTYVAGGSWKLTSLFTSIKYAKNMNQDGGPDPGIYEIGNDLNLANFARGLVGYWKFDEGSGTTAKDSSGNNNDGTLYSSSTICSTPPSSNCPTWTQGKVGGALSFDGMDDYVKTTPVPSIGLSNAPYTFIAMVNVGIGETQGNIIHMSSGSNGLGWCLPPLSLHANKFRGHSWTGTGNSVYSNTIAQVNRWYHIANTWDSINGLRIFVDGLLENIKNQSNYSGSNTNNYIWFAFTPNWCSGDVGWFDGIIDEVRIYNRALSESEIKAIYEATK